MMLAWRGSRMLVFALARSKWQEALPLSFLYKEWGPAQKKSKWETLPPSKEASAHCGTQPMPLDGYNEAKQCDESDQKSYQRANCEEACKIFPFGKQGTFRSYESHALRFERVQRYTDQHCWGQNVSRRVWTQFRKIRMRGVCHNSRWLWNFQGAITKWSCCLHYRFPNTPSL